MPTGFRPISLVLFCALLVVPASSLGSLPQNKVGGTRMSTSPTPPPAAASAGGEAAAAGAASGSEGGDTTGHGRSRDVWSFNTAMSQGIKDGELNFKGAVGMLDAMREEGISPNAGTYGSIMDAAMLGGGEDRQTSLDALDLLDSMPTECRSNHVYAVCIQLMGRIGRGGDVGSMVERARVDGLRLDSQLTDAAIAASAMPTGKKALQPSAAPAHRGGGEGVEAGDDEGGEAGVAKRETAYKKRMSKADRRKLKKHGGVMPEGEPQEEEGGLKKHGGVMPEGEPQEEEGGEEGIKVVGESVSLTDLPLKFAGRVEGGKGTGKQRGGAGGAGEMGGGKGVGQVGGRVGGGGAEVDDWVKAMSECAVEGGGADEADESDEEVGAMPIKESDITWGEEGGEGKGKGRELRFAVEKGQVQAQRLDQYLSHQMPFLSRSACSRLIKEGCVIINGVANCKPAGKLRGGDSILVCIPAPPGCADIKPEPIPLHVLYEDDALVIVNKQAGLTVHPCKGVTTGTLVHALAYHFTQTPESGGLSSVGSDNARPGIVHRLDRYTSGSMVVAKNDLAHWRLSEAFAQRKTDKRYIALVHGELANDVGVVDAMIGRDPQQRERMCVRTDGAGKTARTTYRVRERYAGYTLVELELHTGRTHQIRVHLSHIGHSIVGDTAYGGSLVTEADLKGKGISDLVVRRQALHAATLKFDHPISGKKCAFTAPLLSDMRDAVTMLREHKMRSRSNVPGATVDLSNLGL